MCRVDDPPPGTDAARCQLAKLFDARYIRIFSFFIRHGSNPDDHKTRCCAGCALAEVAEAANVILLHENEKDIYGDVPARCHDIVTSVDSPNLRLAWDPANFVQVGVRPFTEGYSLLRPYVVYVQVKDALLADGSVVVAGAGDGQVVETVRALRDDGFDGFFSLEPHLGKYTEFGALSGPELFTVPGAPLPTFSSGKEFRTHEHRRNRNQRPSAHRPGGRWRDRHHPRRGDQRPRRPDRVGRGRRPQAGPGRAGGREARRQAVHLA